VAAEIRKENTLTGVYMEAFNEGRNYSLTIVETQIMKQEVVADANAMRNDLAETGKALTVRGIAASRLKSAGVGPYSPVASNDKDEGKAKNRRVEFVKQ
jgi:hypothetical protein